MKPIIDRQKCLPERDLKSLLGSSFRWKGMRALHANRGFSLVEVVLAIGLTTFALLVMFSLMPVGLNTLQDANRQIVEAEIFNIVGAEITTTKFNESTHTTDLQAYVASSRFPIYYDMEGLEVPSTGPWVYAVRCTLETPELGGEIRRAIIAIGYRKDPQNMTDDDPGKKRRAFLLSDRGI